jgi:replicative DNA helicase
MNERRPACDEDSERALLGCILLNSERTFFILNELKFTPEMFHVRAHQIIYQTMQVLASKHVPVEPIALIERLRAKGHADEVGGHAYLMKCLDAPLVETYAPHYAEQVVEKYKLRALIECGRNIQVYADEGQTAAEIGANLMSSLISHQSVESEENVEALHDKSLGIAKTIHEGGQRPGCPSFLEPINSVIGSYMPKYTYILAATTSNGKTSLACNELTHKVIDLNIPAALISMEMSQQTIRQIMAATMAGVNAFEFFMLGRYTDLEADAVKEAFGRLAKAPLHIIDRRMNIEQIVTWLTYKVKKSGVKFAVLDYIQLIKYSQGHQQLSRNEQTAEWSALLKDAAKRLDIPLLIISQISRSGNKTRELTPPPPAGEALRDSGMLENDADAIIFIYKKPGEPFESFVTDWPMEIDIFKARTGPVGTVKVVFRRNRQKFVSEDDFNGINQQQKLKLGGTDGKKDRTSTDPYSNP